MTEYLLTGLVCFLTFLVLRGGWRREAKVLNLAPQGEALFMGLLAVAAAMYFWGIMAGLALIFTVIVHEFGHVAAFRVAGHQDATFRLVPLFGGVAISKTQPKTDLDSFYISIMGPGICLALMCISFLLADVLMEISVTAAIFFWYLAMITGFLNFFNLLPLWPLDGGRIFRVLTQTFSPKLGYYISIGTCVLLIGYSIYTRSFLLTIFAVYALQSALATPTYRARRSLSAAQLIMATGAWICMLAAFGLGGGQFFLNFF